MSDISEFEELFARLDDLCVRTSAGNVGISGFLSPREARQAERYLRSKGVRYLLFGGYEGAERVRVYVLPDYMESAESVRDIEEYGFSTDIGGVCIATDGYRRLTHRDYMGSILGMGIERDVIGDILVAGEDGARAYLICTEAIRTFLCAQMNTVAREKAKLISVGLDELEIPEKRFTALNDTVASPRLDCVVGALCSLSREKSRAAVEGGLVELEYEQETRPDKMLTTPCVISVRGYGKYRVLSLNDKTKKGRYRLSAEKFL